MADRKMTGGVPHGAFSALDELDLLEIGARGAARNLYGGAAWAVFRRAVGGGFDVLAGPASYEEAAAVFTEHYKPVHPVNVFLVHESRWHDYGDPRGEETS